MIQANELRIGNKIEFTAIGAIVDVIGIALNSDNILFIQSKLTTSTFFEQPVKYKPIPLTEERLLKCGFKKRIYNISDKWYIGENPVTHDWLFDITWIHGYPNPFYRNGFHEIKYLHQLQNLYFSLTGEELEINL